MVTGLNDCDVGWRREGFHTDGAADGVSGAVGGDGRGCVWWDSGVGIGTGIAVAHHVAVDVDLTTATHFAVDVGNESGIATAVRC